MNGRYNKYWAIKFSLICISFSGMATIVHQVCCAAAFAFPTNYSLFISALYKIGVPLLSLFNSHIFLGRVLKYIFFVLFFFFVLVLYIGISHMSLTHPRTLPMETNCAQAKQRSFSTSDTWWSIVLVFRLGSYGEGTISQVFEETQLKLAGWLRTNGGHPWMMSDWQYCMNLMYLFARDVQA